MTPLVLLATRAAFEDTFLGDDADILGDALPLSPPPAVVPCGGVGEFVFNLLVGGGDVDPFGELGRRGPPGAIAVVFSSE
jgi:hypothetical protein